MSEVQAARERVDAKRAAAGLPPMVWGPPPPLPYWAGAADEFAGRARRPSKRAERAAMKRLAERLQPPE